jgi:hypothetical protein
MKRIVLLALVLSALLLAKPLLSDTKPPQSPSTGSVEVRANAAFDKGDYATALPLLMIVAKQTQDQPTKLGSIQERIRVCQTNLTKNAPTDTQAADKPKTSPEQRKPHVRPKDGEALVVAVKDLGNFEYDAEKGGNLPEDVKKLSGVKIRTHGFMIPLDQADNITEFALVPSLFACCFGQPPQVQHTLVVHAPKGKAVSYFPDEIVVEGMLKVQEKKEDGLVVSVFEIDCLSVKPAAK